MNNTPLIHSTYRRRQYQASLKTRIWVLTDDQYCRLVRPLDCDRRVGPWQDLFSKRNIALMKRSINEAPRRRSTARLSTTSNQARTKCSAMQIGSKIVLNTCSGCFFAVGRRSMASLLMSYSIPVGKIRFFRVRVAAVSTKSADKIHDLGV